MIERFILPHFREFQPYQSARSLVLHGEVLLDANELSLGSPVEFGGQSLNRYPDPLQRELRASLAAYAGVTPDMIFTGVGSDEIIDLLIRLTCLPARDAIGVCEPTYGLYRVAANISNITTRSVGLDASFQIPLEEALGVFRNTVRIIFCCSPNNPTGNLLHESDILALAGLPDSLVVVDQAYVEFSRSPGTLSGLILRQPNLVVLRTLSKAWGLAGIRLGYCIAHPDLVSYLDRIKAPYNINSLTGSIAREALGKRSFMEEAVRVIRAERERVGSELRRLPSVIRVLPSDANFLLVEFRDADRIFNALMSKKIVVRRRSEERLRTHLRITIGTPPENDRLLAVIRECA